MINLSVFNNPVVRYASVFAAGALVTFLVLPSGTYSKDELLKKEQEIQTSYQSQIDEKQKQYDQLKMSSQLEIDKKQEELVRRESQYTQKFSLLLTENQSLRRSSERVTIEIRYPDGRVEKRTTSRSVLESESQKVTQLQQESERKLKETTDRLTQEHSLKIEQLESTHQAETSKLSLELLQTKETLKLEQEKHTDVTLNKRNLSLAAGKKLNSTISLLAEYDFYGPIFAGSMVDLKGRNYDTAGFYLGLRL